jgi:nicotinate-nucleotide adenylyltransferase
MLEIADRFKLEQVRWIPSKIPVHRPKPVAGLEQRISWLRQSLYPYSEFVVDLREVERESPSWMVLTLESLQREEPQSPLVLIVGMDAFQKIELWHRWQDIFSYAHLIVTHRPGFEIPQSGGVAKLLEDRLESDIALLRDLPSSERGGVIFLASVKQLNISSTEIRSRISTRKDLSTMLPKQIESEVIEYYR